MPTQIAVEKQGITARVEVRFEILIVMAFSPPPGGDFGSGCT
jgi:hypothetical protein